MGRGRKVRGVLMSLLGRFNAENGLEKGLATIYPFIFTDAQIKGLTRL